MIHNAQPIQRPFAVVIGTTEWFGNELAKQFASKGFDLVITGKDESVHETRDELLQFGTTVESHVLEPSTFKDVENLNRIIKNFGHPVDTLAFIAEEGPEGPFQDTALEKEMLIIRQNVMVPVHLMKKIIGNMLERGHGKILISTTLGPVNQSPYEAVFGATKSFLFTFTESLRSEIRNSGVTLTTLLPNPYEEPSEDELKATEDPVEMARESFDALMAGRDYVFAPSLMTRLQGMFSRLIPDKARAFISSSPS